MKINFHQNQLIIKIVLVIGVVLSLIQLFAFRSIWRDEAVLALNIISKSSVDLLKPLDSMQVAPMLYLQIQKLFSEVMPYSDLALRIFPLLCFLLTLFFFYRMFKLIFENKYALVFALSLFVFNTMVLRYSSEVKQYMCDLMVYCAIAFIMIQSHRSGKLNIFLLAITGIISIFLSNVAPVILFTAGLFFLQTPFARQKQTFLKFTAVATIWVLGFAIYYYFFIYNNPNIIKQVGSFSKVGGFLPSNAFQLEFYYYLLNLYKVYFEVLLPFGAIGFYGLGAFFVIGLIATIRQKKIGLLILSLAPILIHFALSFLKTYPALPRLLIYQIPGVIIVVSFGFNQLIAEAIKLTGKRPMPNLVWLIPVFFMAFITTQAHFPFRSAELKKSMTYIKENIDPGEKILITAPAFQAYTYYKEIGFVEFDNPILLSKEWKFENDFYEELKLLNGKVWLLFVDNTNRKSHQIIARLNKEDYKKLDYLSAHKSSAYLIDFGNKDNTD